MYEMSNYAQESHVSQPLTFMYVQFRVEGLTYKKQQMIGIQQNVQICTEKSCLPNPFPHWEK